jgi:hypothetical protein
MEKAVKAGDLADVLARLPDLESRFARLKESMQDFLDEKGPGSSA